MAFNALGDVYAYRNGDLDRYQFAAALTVDTGTAILTGFASGFIAGGIAGFLGGAGVGAIPAAIIGGVGGAVIAGVGLIAFDQARIGPEQQSPRMSLINAVADGFKRWLDR